MVTRASDTTQSAVTGTAGPGGSIHSRKPTVPSSDNVAARCSPRTKAMVVARSIIQGFTVKVKCPSVLCVSTEVTCHSTA